MAVKIKRGRRTPVPRSADVRLDDLARADISLPKITRLDDINIQCNPSGCTINNSCLEGPRGLTPARR